MTAAVTTSIVMPVYNTASYLAAAFDSIRAQTNPDFEVIVVDDGSTDGSIEIIDSYVAADSRFRKVEQAHAKQGAARNRGLELARGEYVYFMDSDDVIEPDLIERCVAACEADELDFCIFDSLGFIDDPTQPLAKLPREVCNRSGFVEDRIYDGTDYWTRYWNYQGITFVCWQHFIRRSFLLDNGIVFEENVFYEDNPWTLKLFLGTNRMRYLPCILHRYRVHEHSTLHGGFSIGLMKACFYMHDVLIPLAERESEPRRRKMAEDVLRLNVKRFDQLMDVDDPHDHIGPLREFVDKLKSRLAANELSGFERMVTSVVLLHIGLATAGWDERCLSNSDYKHIESAMPFLRQDMHLGVYGMGVVSNEFIRAFSPFFEELRIEVTFLSTTEQTGGTHLGCPISNICDASKLALDGVVIASTRYTSEMVENVQRHLGNVPTWRITRGFTFFV